MNATNDRSSLERFSDRAINYAQYRPSYPSAAIDCILEGLVNPLVAADIGAGTGIASRLLARREVRVLAIEPNAAMRQAAVPHLLVEYREGTAEKTNLPDASVDLVTCFQAFHWFDRKATLIELRRLLKPSGKLAIVYNLWDLNNRVTASYNRIICKAAFANPFKRFYEAAIAPSDVAIRWYEWILSRSLHRQNYFNTNSKRFAHTQTLNRSQLIGLTKSFSIVPLSDIADRQLISDLSKLCERYGDRDGKVFLKYRTIVYSAQNSIF
jgi:ubiquinone/menaquinone biosynthesis C-methylase UbiE